MTTIKEYIAKYSRESIESTTPSKFAAGGNTPIESPRHGREKTLGAKLPGDKAEPVNNKYLNNPQAAIRILRSGNASQEEIMKAQAAVVALRKSSGEMAMMPQEGILRATPQKPTEPSNIKPVWDLKHGEMNDWKG